MAFGCAMLILVFLSLALGITPSGALDRVPLLKPDEKFSEGATAFIDISKAAYNGQNFVFGLIPKSGGLYFHSFLKIFANVSHCLPGTGRREFCNFWSVKPNKVSSIFSMQQKYPSARFLVFLRDPLIQALSQLGNLDDKLVNNCALTSFVHTGGCLNLTGVNNLQTDALGGGNLINAVSSLQNLFWFGIFELFEVSVCLLSIQLGQFNRSLCSCDSKDLLRLSPGKLANNNYTSTSIIEVGAMLRKDKYLYAKGLIMFLSRVSAAEKIVKSTIICPHRDPSDILQIKLLVDSGQLL